MPLFTTSVPVRTSGHLGCAMCTTAVSLYTTHYMPLLYTSDVPLCARFISLCVPAISLLFHSCTNVHLWCTTTYLCCITVYPFYTTVVLLFSTAPYGQLQVNVYMGRPNSRLARSNTARSCQGETLRLCTQVQLKESCNGSVQHGAS